MNAIYLFHAWHNQGLCQMTFDKFEDRLAEVRRDKPVDELDLRIHYLMAHLPTSKSLAELDKARAEWNKAWDKAWAKRDKALDKRDKARAEWVKAWVKRGKALDKRDKRDKALAELEKALAELEKALAELEKAQAEWDKAWEGRAKRDKALAEWNRKWHPVLCHPKCAWTPENLDIFAKGKSLERLLR